MSLLANSERQKEQRTHYSVTSSKTISKPETKQKGVNSHYSGKKMKKRWKAGNVLTKSSNPSNVPVNSRSFFMTTQILEPMHLSMSSLSYQISGHPVNEDACT